MMDEFDEVAERALAAGYAHFFVADDIEDLAEQTGIPVETPWSRRSRTTTTCATSARTPSSARNASTCGPIGRGQDLCGQVLHCGAYGSIGGVQINEHGEVLERRTTSPFPGCTPPEWTPAPSMATATASTCLATRWDSRSTVAGSLGKTRPSAWHSALPGTGGTPHAFPVPLPRFITMTPTTMVAAPMMVVARSGSPKSRQPPAKTPTVPTPDQIA